MGSNVPTLKAFVISLSSRSELVLKVFAQGHPTTAKFRSRITYPELASLPVGVLLVGHATLDTQTLGVVVVTVDDVVGACLLSRAVVRSAQRANRTGVAGLP